MFALSHLSCFVLQKSSPFSSKHYKKVKQKYFWLDQQLQYVSLTSGIVDPPAVVVGPSVVGKSVVVSTVVEPPVEGPPVETPSVVTSTVVDPATVDATSGHFPHVF